VVDVVEILEGNEDEPLTLVGRLRKVPECFQHYVSMITRQYVDMYSGWLSPIAHTHH